MRLLQLAAAFAIAASGPVSAQDAPPVQDGGDFVLMLGGDLLGPYGADGAARPAGEFAQVADLIRTADATFANQEGSGFDLKGFKGSVAAENGGGYPLHSLATLRNLRAMGINLLSRANNHGTDWGIEGLTATDQALDAIGIAHAGTGQSLAEARSGAVLDTGRGKVALVATASTFPGMSPAGDAARGAGPRPGISPLHVEPVIRVTAAEMKALRSIVLRGGWQGYDPPGKAPAEVHLADKAFRLGQPGLTYDVSAADRAALLGSVATARRNADKVLFTIHAHETLSGAFEDPAPADFLPPLFHDAIDQGASAVVRHGPHAVGGVEIFKGRPIFYGLGSLFFDLPSKVTLASDGPNKQVLTLPATWWEGMLAGLHYRGGRLAEIRLYPLVLASADGPGRGLPRLASGAAAQAILKRVQEFSRPYGTQIRISGDIGIIDALPAQP